MTVEQHIVLEGLTGVGRVELSLQPDQRVYAFIGSNGVGKTKCLEALFLWLFFTHEGVLAYCAKNPSKTFVDSKSVVGQIVRNGELVYALPPAMGEEQKSVADKLVTDKSILHEHPVVFLGAMSRAALGENPVLPKLEKFAVRRAQYWDEIIHAIHSAQMSSMNMETNLTNWFVLRAQSANPYQRSEDNRKVEIDTLLRLLSEVDAQIDPTFLEIDASNQVFIKINGTVTQLEHLSSGFTSLLKMLQAIVAGFANFTNEVNLTQVPGIVLIDEIESHLHPQWQSKIIPLLETLFPNTTFYVATHSPIVLSQLQQGEAYRLERQADGVVRSTLIKAPNRRILDDVLDDAMGVDLNALKRVRLEQDDQTELKQKLQNLLDRARSKT